MVVVADLRFIQYFTLIIGLEAAFNSIVTKHWEVVF